MVRGWPRPRSGRFTPRGKTPVTIIQEAGWVRGPVWTGAKNLFPTGIRSPDPPACSEALAEMGKFYTNYLCHSLIVRTIGPKDPLRGRSPVNSTANTSIDKVGSCERILHIRY
jgi:hypothetical protein